MSLITKYSPLLHADSPLDSHAKALIEELYRREQERALTLPTDDPLDPKRRKRVDYTWDELTTQLEAIRDTLERESPAILHAATQVAAKPINRIIMTGCGDSLGSMIGVRALYESLLNVPTEPIQALDFVNYYAGPVNEKTLVVVLSSSGNTTRTVEALLLAQARGAQTLALSNTPGSPLVEEADEHVLIHAERKGWPTQSSTAAMAILHQFAFELARQKGANQAEVSALESALHQTPAQIARIIEEHSDGIAGIAADEAKRATYLFAGGGPSYACALFGAAKVKECSPDHAIAIPLEEYHHYNSQKVGDPLFLIAPTGPTLPRALDTAREGHRWGGQIYSVVTEGDHTLEADSDALIPLPAIDERLAPMTYSIPVQLFAYHVAMAKFRLAEKENG